MTALRIACATSSVMASRPPSIAAITCSVRSRSMSSPPRCVSPLVASTWNKPSSTLRIEMSKVPPPRSYTAMVPRFRASRPYASAAAVGSLMMRSTSSPAMRPASRVAVRCASLKYAGTVMTARSTSKSNSPAFRKYSSARHLSSRRTNAEISGGVNSRSPMPTRTTPPPVSPSAPAACRTVNGSVRASSRTSSRPRPMNRFTE